MKIINGVAQFLYKNVAKKILFLINPETVHRRMTAMGERLGESGVAKRVFAAVFSRKSPQIAQSVFGLEFLSPMGLAAGFDYHAELTQILPALGFGFGTIGTLTNKAYEGNPGPMLGRLPKSQSLMVNKGFKNKGVGATLKKLAGKTFAYPVGVSIGKTNTEDIKTQQEAIEDIVASFQSAEKSGVPFTYYELNISCPNLSGSVEFYHPDHLDQLLKAVDGLRVSRPIFIKMPISKTDHQVCAMMDVIVRYPSIKAVIFGNLQNNRNNQSFKRDEVERFPKGNFSGLPCRQRSDELISLVFKKYGPQIKIIGCGGVFCAQDAYRKIKLGATLVQLITGLVFEGPQLVSQINEQLVDLLKKDGYDSIGQAIGTGELLPSNTSNNNLS